MPAEKLLSRFPRTLKNLRLATLRLPLVLVYENDDLRELHRFVVATEHGAVVEVEEPVPEWLAPLLPPV